MIRKYKNAFRVLKKWNIRSCAATKDCRAMVSIHPKKRSAVVYGYGRRNAPKDYYLHEVLHCAIREVTRTDKRRVKEQRDAEEKLVQDICKLVFPKT